MDNIQSQQDGFTIRAGAYKETVVGLTELEYRRQITVKIDRPRQMLVTFANDQKLSLLDDEGVEVRNYPYIERHAPGYVKVQEYPTLWAKCTVLKASILAEGHEVNLATGLHNVIRVERIGPVA